MKEKGQKELKRGELFSICRSRYFHKVSELDPVLELLEEHGYLYVKQPPRLYGTGRAPDRMVCIAPEALTQ